MGGINSDPYYATIEVIFYITSLSILAYFLPLFVTIFLLAPLVTKLYLKMSTGICKSFKRLDGKTVIITGANIGIGLETAKDLARRGAKIILACRSMDKGNVAMEEIRKDTGSNALVLKQLDLSSFASVRKFCKEIIAEEPRLDILINNAGVIVTEKSLTKDNLETSMQSNHFSPFLLTHLLLDLMRRAGNARIVNVSSLAHSMAWTFDPENLNCEKHFSGLTQYNQTKLANVYFTTELNRRCRSAGITEITVNCLHPGGVRTALSRSINESLVMQIFDTACRFFFKTAVEGAQTTIHVAVSEELDGVSGEYFFDCQKTPASKLGQNVDNARILWEKSVAAVGLKQEETIVPL